MSNKQMTAVEWFIDKLNLKYSNDDFIITFINEIEQAKEMEKEQIIDAFWEGDNTDCISEQNSKEFAEKYYKETYEQ
jgi:hypothetical protein